MTVRRVADVKAGSLMYLLNPPEPRLALRLDHPQGGCDPNKTYPAALVFLGKVNDRMMPVVDGGATNYPCIDCGISAELVWDPPITLLKPAATAEAGHLLLIGNRLGVSSSNGQGGMALRMYWDPYTGRAIDPQIGAVVQRVIIVKWRLGAIDQTGTFRQLIAYPEDYVAEWSGVRRDE
jgi:hypothetical protein